MNKQTNKEKPPCTLTSINEPNIDLMAKAFLNLYYQTKNTVKMESA